MRYGQRVYSLTLHCDYCMECVNYTDHTQRICESWAASEGWQRKNGKDRCPECAEKLNKQEDRT